MTARTEVDRILEEARSGADWIATNVELDDAFLRRAVQSTLDQLGPDGGGPDGGDGGGPSSPPPPSRGIFAKPWIPALAGGCLVAAVALAIYAAREPPSEPSRAPVVAVEVSALEGAATTPTVEAPAVSVRVEPSADPQPVIMAPREPVEPEPIGKTSKTAKVPSARELFQQANATRTDKQFDEARELYEQLVRVYPRTREAAMAHISLGRLELEHFARPEVALEHFDAYLDGEGSKPLAGEALVGRARALQQLGDASGEAAAWRQLLDKHPDSPHAERAQRRLTELSGG